MAGGQQAFGYLSVYILPKPGKGLTAKIIQGVNRRAGVFLHNKQIKLI